MPTLDDSTRHEVGHMPHAAWCWSCVAGTSKSWQVLCLKASDENSVRGVACDCCFMGDSGVSSGVGSQILRRPMSYRKSPTQRSRGVRSEDHC